jgi:hypothetical protein
MSQFGSTARFNTVSPTFLLYRPHRTLSQTDHHRLQIPAIDGREVLTQDDFCKRIRHWNASGHKKLGQQLGDFLNRLIDID